jgi:N-glycosylase/DNA lyase
MPVLPSRLPRKAHLPDDLAESYKTRREAIRQRLADFAAVPQTEWFYETAYCLLTPQSKAVHADQVIHLLKERDFLHTPFDPVQILREPLHYIRFHRVKSDRLLRLQEQWPVIETIIAEARNLNSREGRDELSAQVNGMGLKEASHVLRNIGCRGLAIIDRHLLRCLVACSVIPEEVVVGSSKQYHAVENLFDQFSVKVGINMDELDLLFWSEIAGLILK